MNDLEVFDYECNGQFSMFDYTIPQFKIDNKIRLIELFAGYGSQAMALDIIGADYEHYKVVEFDKYAVQSYNAVHGTNFEPTDIRNVHGKDLEICDTYKFTYMLTYSFPCTDLSVAGKMQGMKKGSGTRSGLLWEVERIMAEIYESGGELPQVLFMENVPQVTSSANINDFHAWQDFLTSLGYTNYVEVLNAKDYGVAQNRKRCFMFSFLGEFNYKFPEPIKLTKAMKDYLEDEVEEKYYINSEKANKLISDLIKNNELPGEKSTCVLKDMGESFDRYTDTAVTLRARDYKGLDNYGSNGVIEEEVKLTMLGQMDNTMDNTFESANRVYDCNGLCPTIPTMAGGNIEPKTIVAMRGRNPYNPSDRTVGSPTEQRLEPNSQDLCNTITSVQKDNMVLENSVLGTLYSGASEQFGCGYMPDICRIESLYRIRKLTPRECGRLMAVSDENINRILSVVSNSQAYKQFGNSIVVMCMVAMFSNLNIQNKPLWSDIKYRY